MKLKYEYETIEIDNEIVAVPVGESASKTKMMLRLNKSAAEVLELLKEDTTIDSIVEQLKSKYDTPADKIKAFVEEYIQELINKGIVA
ncbi:MAG: PqqD family protein [Holdemanella sp.]|nr:PqqD family protein [Holdemanella sp.]